MGPTIPIRDRFTYLQYLRLKRGLSRAALVREIFRVTQTPLSMRPCHIRIIEDGEGVPSDEELDVIARTLNVSPGDLLKPVNASLPEIEETTA